MSLNQITEQVSQLGTAWEQFKQVNNQRLAEIERKGNADPLYSEHLAKINHALDNHKSRMSALETTMSRPAVSAAGYGYKAASPYAGEYSKAFTIYLRKGMDAGLENLESKALSVGSDADGGYTVTPANEPEYRQGYQ